MKMVLPVDGYRSAPDFMTGLQDSQGDMFWLYKQQGHWHGGIHFFDNFATSAVWQTGSQTGLKSMTDGQIVAWRINDEYRTADYNGNALKFSSTFLLLKSTCTPDTTKPEHALDFYTLWMQLAPLQEYGFNKPVVATITADKLAIRQDIPDPEWRREGLPTRTDGMSAWEKTKYIVPLDTGAKIYRGSEVEILVCGLGAYKLQGMQQIHNTPIN